MKLWRDTQIKLLNKILRKLIMELSKHNILLKEAAIHFVNQIPEIDEEFWSRKYQTFK